MAFQFLGSPQLVLGQVCRENGICQSTAVPWLLDLMDLSGCVVTVDAPCAGPDLVRGLLGRNADYVVELRPEAGRVYDQVESRFREMEPLPFFQQVADQRFDLPRIRRWEYHRNDLAFLGHEDWEGVGGIGMVETEIETADAPRAHRRFFVSSLTGSATAFFSAVETHAEVSEGTLWTITLTFPNPESMANVAGTFAILKDSLTKAA